MIRDRVYPIPNSVEAEPETEQVTFTFAIPEPVLDLTFHVQDTAPEPDAFVVPIPAAVESRPLGRMT